MSALSGPRNYDEASEYLGSFVNFERQPPDQQARKFEVNLERIEWLLDQVGSPHLAAPCVHVAGTKGKGSVAAMAESIARAAGLVTGLYTSPHLVDVRERILVSGRKIPREDFTRHVQSVYAHLEAARSRPDVRRPTYFEVMTHLAFLHFRDRKVEFASIEVGMGGRLDATNVVNPVACAITNISFDHTRQLGGTLREIASEKAGIIKPGAPVVVSPNLPEPLAAIEKAARAAGSEMLLVGRDVVIEPSGRAFSIRTPTARFGPLEIPLSGAFQRENAANAVALTELFFRRTERTLAPEAVSKGLASVRWPGRLEVVARRPLVILDGAHNRASMEAALGAVAAEHRPERLVVVFGAAGDKDITGMAEVIASSASNLVITESGNPRQSPLSELADAMAWSGATGEQIADLGPALERAKALAGERGAVVVTGSLYLVGKAMKLLGVPAWEDE